MFSNSIPYSYFQYYFGFFGQVPSDVLSLLILHITADTKGMHVHAMVDQ